MHTTEVFKQAEQSPGGMWLVRVDVFAHCSLSMLVLVLTLRLSKRAQASLWGRSHWTS
jgi:hypothetical protein